MKNSDIDSWSPELLDQAAKKQLILSIMILGGLFVTLGGMIWIWSSIGIGTGDQEIQFFALGFVLIYFVASGIWSVSKYAKLKRKAAEKRRAGY